MSYVETRESRGFQAIASDDALGSKKITKAPGVRVEALQPMHRGGSPLPRITKTPLPRVPLPIQAVAAVYSPAGPTRASTAVPYPGYLPGGGLKITVPEKGSKRMNAQQMLEQVTVTPRPGRPLPGSPPVLSMPIDPSVLVEPRLPTIVMTAPAPGSSTASQIMNLPIKHSDRYPSASPSTSGGPSPSAFPTKGSTTAGGAAFPSGPGPEVDTMDVRDLVQTAPVAQRPLVSRNVMLIAGGVAAVGLVYLLTRKKATK